MSSTVLRSNLRYIHNNKLSTSDHRILFTMSTNLCSGIDLGDYCSVSGIFFVNKAEPEESSVVLSADRNGSKFSVYRDFTFGRLIP